MMPYKREDDIKRVVAILIVTIASIMALSSGYAKEFLITMSIGILIAIIFMLWVLIKVFVLDGDGEKPIKKFSIIGWFLISLLVFLAVGTAITIII